jgi:flagellar biosynthesis protein
MAPDSLPPNHPPHNRSEKRLAIALEYEHGIDPAPRVSATGQGFIADHILELARQHGIPVHEDKPLAEILATLELQTTIPIQAYAAVAEILSYLYKKQSSSPSSST